MELINQEIESYLAGLVRSTHPVLREMEQVAAELNFPIIGPQVGRLLSSLTLASGAKRVLDLGSGFGYSAVFFAHAGGPEGTVILTESSARRADQAREFLTKAGLIERAEFQVGDALEIGTSLAGERFDVVFNDIEKKDYPRTLEIARALLGVGGMFICDNMLCCGRVIDPADADEVTAGVVELTRALYQAKDFVTTLIPIRDGVTLSVKQPIPDDTRR